MSAGHEHRVYSGEPHPQSTSTYPYTFYSDPSNLKDSPPVSVVRNTGLRELKILSWDIFICRFPTLGLRGGWKLSSQILLVYLEVSKILLWY